MDANNNVVTEFEPMPKKIYQNLKRASVDHAWQLCSTDILAQLLGPDASANALPVPALKGSKVYSPFAVIGQTKAGFGTDKTLKYLGTLPELANTNILTSEARENLQQRPKELSADELTNGLHEIQGCFSYALTGISEQNGKLQQKSVTMSFSGVKACDIGLNLDQLSLDFIKTPQLADYAKIYIVYQTLYCDNTRFSVTIANKERIEEEQSQSTSKGGFLPKLTEKLKKATSFKEDPVTTGNDTYVNERSRPLAFWVGKFELSSKDAKITPVAFDSKKFKEMKWSTA